MHGRKAGLKSFAGRFLQQPACQTHGSTISQLEEDGREDKVFDDSKASGSS